MVELINIPIYSACGGILLRWWLNGWHYYYFTNNFEITMKTSVEDIQVTQVFSIISKIERPTKITTDYSYDVTVDSVTDNQLDGFASLLLAEKVESYEFSNWYEVDITRGEKTLREGNSPGYEIRFEITRKELPNTPAVYQKTQLFYIGDTLADLDDDEVIAINKQVNDIAEMQDRQSDFTQTFKIRKTRAMRELFELSGEVGASTNFPYEQQTCRLVQDGIEVISGGRLSLNKVDEKYYYVAVYSGNKSFFTVIEKLKLTDLLLPSTNHTWDYTAMVNSNETDLDYVYPLVEPSDDGAFNTPNDDGSKVIILEDAIWPFIKIKAIWDEIFSTAGYTPSGEILNDSKFLNSFMPIVSLKATNTNKFLFSLYNNTTVTHSIGYINKPGNVAINGAEDSNWVNNTTYLTRLKATYKVRIYIKQAFTILMFVPPVLEISVDGVDTSMDHVESEILPGGIYIAVFEVEVSADANQLIRFKTSVFFKSLYYDISITSIEDASIAYSSAVVPSINLPEITQTDFIKLICNMFGLIPEANPRDKTIFFWNYKLLYDNIPRARDWSAYLSEKDDEVEFKFGDYAQLNYLKFKEIDDVIKGNGTGVMQVNDVTLPAEKDMITVPVSYSDEVIELTDVIVSRIPFNKWDAQGAVYEANDKIDPRIVYVSALPDTKTLTFKVGVTEYDCDSAKKASSLEISFSSLAARYGYLANMLTKTNLRRAKFNLPVYEVSGFKHYIPIYLSQYKAYFYVNKINNYVNGKLCTIDLIKL